MSEIYCEECIHFEKHPGVLLCHSDNDVRSMDHDYYYECDDFIEKSPLTLVAKRYKK